MASSKHQTTRLVYKFLTEHPGQIMHYSDIADALRLNRENVNAALVRMGNIHPEYGVRRTTAGHYRFSPADMTAAPDAPEPEKREGPELYEKVGITQTGDIIIRDEKGLLYKIGDVL